MRLKRVEQGHSGPRKLMLKAASLVLGADPYDVVKMLMYRPDFLAGKFNPLCQDIMRGASSWSVGERELFAAFVSRTSRCLF